MIYIQATNGEKVFNTMQPSFYIHYTDPATLFTEVVISTTPDMSSVIYTSNVLTRPEEWPPISEIKPNRTIHYTVPFGILSEGATYYIRVDSAPIVDLSDVIEFRIEGATYPILLSSFTGSQEIVPARNGFKVTEIITGCGRVNKKVITINFAPMKKGIRDVLYNDFFIGPDFYGDVRGELGIRDQQGVSTPVYWGDADRNIEGDAILPRDPVFGIKLMNLKAGAIRYNGSVTFSER